MARAPNYRLAKIHRNYTVEEAATTFGVHRNTVREWIRRGLRTTDGRRPALILGRDLADFLRARRLKNRRPCRPGEIYCMRCRVPTAPAYGMVDYEAVTPALGNLVGICPACEALMYRRVNPARLRQAAGDLAVTLPEGQ
ncbi:MAG: helix-turn-helix domain-containing protein [Vicinamibacterales bacterium]